MTTETTPTSVSKKALWIGWVMTILPALMLLFSASMKLAHPPQLDEGFAHLGIPVSHAFGLGLLEFTCALIYLIPRTSIIGAILLTGYLGGAIQTHLRIGEGFIPQVILGVLLWGGLFLRDVRLRALIPFRT
jgi:hypothetical protein